MRLSAAALLLFAPLGCSAEPPRAVRVLSLNIEVDGGPYEGSPEDRLPRLIELLRRVDADVLCLQEAGEKPAAKIARALGYHHLQTGGDTPVLSRWPLRPLAGGRMAEVQLDARTRLRVMNIHLSHAPYQPYQLLRIPYANGRFIAAEAEAVAEAKAARGKEVEQALALLGAGEEPVVVAGDFNEPSHLDWTAEAARAGRHPIKVSWPSSKSFARAGFMDAYRRLHRDVMARPGYTWTNRTRADDPKDHHDRIDMILYRGAGLKPVSAQLVGESAENADIVFTPYPTDHRGVLAAFQLAPAR